jgi:hypothetical protein
MTETTVAGTFPAGAELVREYGGTSAVLRLAGTWLLELSQAGRPS